LVEAIQLQAQLKAEYGAWGTEEPIKRAEEILRVALAALEGLPNDPALAAREPNDLDAISALRPSGPRRLWTTFDQDSHRTHLAGALLGRLAGCTLGAPVEFWPSTRWPPWPRRMATISRRATTGPASRNLS
jgi:hypothetical protein